MMSCAQTLIGVGTMVYPLMIHFLLNEYGFRGMVAVIAAINAHVIFAMLVMHPVEWHYKVVEIPIEDAKPCKMFIFLVLLNFKSHKKCFDFSDG